jgi:signal transduction histidine kinase
MLATAVAIAVVMVTTGVVLDALLRAALYDQFDAALAARARALAVLVEQETDGLEVELTEVPLPEFEPGRAAAYYLLSLQDGTVIAHSPSFGRRAPEFSATPTHGARGTTLVLPDGRPGRAVGYTFDPRKEPGLAADAIPVTLVLARGTEELSAALLQLRAILLAVGCAAAAIAVAVLAGIVNRGLRPVLRLSGRIARIAPDDLTVRISDEALPRELMPIAARLNELLERLERAFERERRFTGDVAHELRNPLAALRAGLELTLAREREPAEYRAAALAALAIGGQMQSMVENLLHLARADAGQLELRSASVDVARLVRECWPSHAAAADARDVRVRHPSAGTVGPIESDAEKLRLVLHNLFDNATTYADRGGEIEIAANRTGDSVEITIRNTAAGLAAGDATHVFDRFWRADTARGQDAGVHCGLGLPLCRAIIERLGGRIAAEVADGQFVVSIRLPCR